MERVGLERADLLIPEDMHRKASALPTMSAPHDDGDIAVVR
jgi:hypothetical protein